MFIQQAFDVFLNFAYERIDEKSVKLTLPVKPLFLNSVGVVHGGIISSLADVAMCNALGVYEDGIQKAVTVDLKVSFLKGAKGASLKALAHVVKEGRSLTHTDCFIYDDEENLVARASGILFHC
ncbi:MAG TPA: PaaI family thioesterase [Bacillota bacterium]|nr:PaaI family thioesterase [Bacillota bacterium]